MKYQASSAWRSLVRLPTEALLLVLAITLAGIPTITVTDAVTWDSPGGTILAESSVNLEKQPETPWLKAEE